jgi:hypothetical protein
VCGSLVTAFSWRRRSPAGTAGKRTGAVNRMALAEMPLRSPAGTAGKSLDVEATYETLCEQLRNPAGTAGKSSASRCPPGNTNRYAARPRRPGRDTIMEDLFARYGVPLRSPAGMAGKSPTGRHVRAAGHVAGTEPGRTAGKRTTPGPMLLIAVRPPLRSPAAKRGTRSEHAAKTFTQPLRSPARTAGESLANPALGDFLNMPLRSPAGKSRLRRRGRRARAGAAMEPGQAGRGETHGAGATWFVE